MKKLVLFFLCLLLVLTGCSGGGSSDSSESSSDSSSTSNNSNSKSYEITAEDFENPEPEGNTVGSTFTYNGVSVTLDSAEIIPTVENVPPKDGYEYIRLNWTIKNDSGENFNDFVISEGYADTQSVETALAVMDVYITDDLLSGTSAQTQSGFEVPKDFKKLVFNVHMDNTPDLDEYEQTVTKFSVTPAQCTTQ